MATEQNILSELSDALASAVEKAAASTVTVKARRRIPATGIVWSADGTILTANHVVERDEDIKVVLPDGKEVAANLAGRDPGSDLAVLKVAVTSLTAAERAPDDSARVGHMVLAIGRPSSDGPMASSGVISSIGGAWRTFTGNQVDSYIRADVTFYPGFSGGPLVDAAGRVVAINTSRLGRGAGLSIPISAAGGIADALARGGSVKRGYLGIGNQPVRLPAALAAKLDGKQETGLLIVSVESGTPAEAAGLMIGDVLVGMAGKPVTDTEDLQDFLGPESVGKPTPLKVLRGGELQDLTVTIGERT